MSFEKQTLGERAPWSAVFVVALACGCGPFSEGGSGGSAGHAGEGIAGGTPSAGSAGASSAGSSGSNVGGATAGSAGVGVGGSSAGSSAAGSSGVGPPSAEPVIGCSAATWPDAGFYYEPPPAMNEPGPAEVILEYFSGLAMSGNGKVVVGISVNPESPVGRPVPASFTLADSAVLLPQPPYSGEGYPRLASCDGSVVVQQEAYFGEVYRTEGDEVLSLFSYSASSSTLSMDPTGAIIVDGNGQAGFNEETGPIPPVPQEWTAATGTVWLRDVTDMKIYHVSADGSLIGADAEALFRYSPSTRTRRPIGMAPPDGSGSIVVSASGNAWVESADRNADSFLVWRLPAEPLSVTCPGYCEPVDVSSTGAVALIDAGADWDESSWSSLLWTERSGLVDLAELFRRHGVDPGSGRKLRAVALSDDARAFTGYSFDPANPWARSFFYAVMPSAAYE